MSWKETFSREVQPSFLAIGKYLKNPLWDYLTSYIGETYAIEPKIEYSVCSSAPGWNVKYKKGGRSLCVLYPEKDFFTCLVCIGAKEEPKAELLLRTCTEYTRNLYKNCGGLNGTRWMMISVTSRDILEDVKKLVSTRVTKNRR